MLPFRKRLRTSEQVSELMQNTIACIPHTELSDRTASEWLKLWILLAEKYGFVRLESAVNRLKFKLDFFPKPAELQREIDALVEEDRVAARASRIGFVSCGKCSADGWICVNGNGELWTGNKNEDRFATECECRRTWKVSHVTADTQSNMRKGVGGQKSPRHCDP